MFMNYFSPILSKNLSSDCMINKKELKLHLRLKGTPLERVL